MPTEIERKFLVLECDLSRLSGGERVRQGYLCFEPVVRVRVRSREGSLTIKGPGLGRRPEFEYPIPLDEARQLLGLCRAVIEKTRYVIGRVELDVFAGPLAGLVLAEVEGAPADEPIAPPEGVTWIEVTGRPEYENSNLVRYGAPGASNTFAPPAGKGFSPAGRRRRDR